MAEEIVSDNVEISKENPDKFTEISTNDGSRADSSKVPEKANEQVAPANGEQDEPNDEVKSDESEENVPFHKHPRWRKMNEENKSMKGELQSLKEQISKLTPTQQEEVWDDIAELEKIGFGKEEAGKFKQYLDKYFGTKTKNFDGLTNELDNIKINRRIAEFSSTHEDYKTVEPIMVQLVSEMTEDEKNILRNDATGKFLNMLYFQAKSQGGNDFEKGKKVAIADTKLKTEASSFSKKGASAEKKDYDFTVKEIDDMSWQEYDEQKPAILKAERLGRIKQ